MIWKRNTSLVRIFTFLSQNLGNNCMEDYLASRYPKRQKLIVRSLLHRNLVPLDLLYFQIGERYVV